VFGRGGTEKLRMVFRSKGEEVIDEWRKMDNKELRGFISTLNSIRD
jgi:hypothetical protein